MHLVLCADLVIKICLPRESLNIEGAIWLNHGWVKHYLEINNLAFHVVRPSIIAVIREAVSLYPDVSAISILKARDTQQPFPRAHPSATIVRACRLRTLYGLISESRVPVCRSLRGSCARVAERAAIALHWSKVVPIERD